jgi:hypothetical protein
MEGAILASDTDMCTESDLSISKCETEIWTWAKRREQTEIMCLQRTRKQIQMDKKKKPI